MSKSLKQSLRPVIPGAFRALYKKYKKRSLSEINYDRELKLLKENYLKLNENKEENQIVLRDGLTLKIHPDCRNGFEHFCYLSPEMVQELNFFISNTKDKKSFLDIGALHGIFSLVFTINAPSKKALAVDASPLAFARLLYNIYKNNLSNITPVDCALSDVSGTLIMHYEWEHAVAIKNSNPNQTYLKVLKKAGDELCESLFFEPDVIKIDVEGHEAKVIKGLTRQIERNKPMVFLELHPNNIIVERDTIKDMLSIFESNGYNAFLTDGVLIPYQDICSFKDIKRILLK